MKKMKKNFRMFSLYLGKGLFFGIGIFVTVFVLYAWQSTTTNDTVDNSLKADTDDTLTLDKWNGLVQRVSGIETATNGDVKIGQLAGSSNRCVYADTNGILHVKGDDCGLAGAGGDDLGNHTASQNIDLNGHKIVNGGSAGIFVDNSGNVSATSFIGDGSNLTGVVTTETDPTVNSLAKTSLSCSAGQIAKWNGTAWACAGDNSGSSTLWTENAGNVYRSAGRVGIGVSGPTVKLDVNGQIWARANGDWFLRGGDDSELRDINVANFLGVYGRQNSDRGGIRLGSDGSYIFGDNGKIGIGTTNPSARLDVAGSMEVSGIYTNNGAGVQTINAATINLQALNTNLTNNLKLENGDIRMHNNTDWSTIFMDPASGTKTMGIIASDDSVWFGRYADNFGGWEETPFRFNVLNGHANATAWDTNSDRRLKKNITPIVNGLDKVMKLNGVEFDRKNGNGHSIGVIAQDIEKILPDIVSTPKKGDSYKYKSVDYDKISAVLIEAIKDLKKEKDGEIKQLQDQVEVLKQEIENLKNK